MQRTEEEHDIIRAPRERLVTVICPTARLCLR